MTELKPTTGLEKPPQVGPEHPTVLSPPDVGVFRAFLNWYATSCLSASLNLNFLLVLFFDLAKLTEHIQSLLCVSLLSSETRGHKILIKICRYSLLRSELLYSSQSSHLCMWNLPFLSIDAQSTQGSLTTYYRRC